MGGNPLFFPDWWRDAGYFLISVESGCGMRIRLNRFYKARPLGSCAYTKSDDYPMEIDKFHWTMYIRGPFDTAREVPCTDLDHDMMFNVPPDGDYVVPSIDEWPAVYELNGTPDSVRNLVEFYMTRDHTHTMDIGKFYMGVVAARYIISGPRVIMRSPPRLPPAIFFVHDAFGVFTDQSGMLELPRP